MFAGLLAKIGLQAAARFVLPSLVYLALTGAFGGFIWWNELADAGVAVLAALSGACLLMAVLLASGWARLALAVIAVGLAFFAGLLQDSERHERELNLLRAEHETHVERLHASYKKKGEEEAARQAKVNLEALRKAAEAQREFEAERDKLRDEREKLKKEAADDKDADRPALSLDAVDRINRLRYDAKPVRPSGAGPKGSRRRAPTG